MKKLTRKNPNDIYSLWLDLSSKDKSKARKAALALRQQFAGKSKFSDFWPIIREENSLTVDEIKAKIDSVIKKTSSARANPVKKPRRRNSMNDQIWDGRNDPTVISWRTKHVAATNIFADWRRHSMFNGKKSFKDFVLSHEDVGKLGELPASENEIMNAMLKMARGPGGY